MDVTRSLAFWMIQCLLLQRRLIPLCDVGTVPHLNLHDIGGASFKPCCSPAIHVEHQPPTEQPVPSIPQRPTYAHTLYSTCCFRRDHIVCWWLSSLDTPNNKMRQRPKPSIPFGNTLPQIFRPVCGLGIKQLQDLIQRFPYIISRLLNE